MNISYREMAIEDLKKLGEIDRSDYSNQVYIIKNGKLICESIEFNHPGFNSRTIQEIINEYSDLLTKGMHTFYGAFDGETLIGIAGFEVKFRGRNMDMYDFGPLWINRESRGLGIGKKLFNISASQAKAMGAKKLYISATPVKSTVDFYIKMGCKVTDDIDIELFNAEPEDIHMEKVL